jgi:hypothetical protein
MVDINANVGSCNVNVKLVIGKHGIGERNENVELLLYLCGSHKLAIGASSLYSQRSIRSPPTNRKTSVLLQANEERNLASQNLSLQQAGSNLPTQ